MENNTKLDELLKQHHLNFTWNDVFGYWWIEGIMTNGWGWHSGYRSAANEGEARKAAVEYLQNFFLDWKI